MEVQRATFDQVRKNQREIVFDVFEPLIKSGDTMDESDREKFFDLLSVSLLGLEKNYDLWLKVDSIGSVPHKAGNLAVWLRKAISFSDAPDKSQEMYILGRNVRVPNSVLWEALMTSCFECMAAALEVSLKISAETFVREGSSFAAKAEHKIEE